MSTTNTLAACLTACSLAVFGPLCQAGDIDRAGAETLMAECQRQRAEHIAPLKEQAIEDCVARSLKDREACERHNQNYGERTRGGTQGGMFWDLPVCQDAVAAEKYFKMNPRSNSFSLP